MPDRPAYVVAAQDQLEAGVRELTSGESMRRLFVVARRLEQRGNERQQRACAMSSTCLMVGRSTWRSVISSTTTEAQHLARLVQDASLSGPNAETSAAALDDSGA